MNLIFEDKIPQYRDAFKAKVIDVAGKLRIDPNWLMMVFWKESKLRPDAVNNITQATGLIQFMPATAISLGTTTSALKSMSNVEQLDFVYKYYYPYRNYITKAEDLYLITFYPNADKKHAGTLSKPDEWVFPDAVYQANKGVDMNGNGQLSISDVREWFWRDIPKDWVPYVQAPVSMPVAAIKFIGRNFYFLAMGALILAVGVYFTLTATIKT